ncbi:E3 ubiquitin-protein ligase RNF187 [Oryx dammah]|uniref:E3 ubiquitin-protein ligase RNF187 n=1 Tax=Oryx dammah TaxID=59534 RepID=UPI001A9C1E5E|nr:E3 ubiquitin-protein ligase RNF187 [Oryx dammah]
MSCTLSTGLPGRDGRGGGGGRGDLHHQHGLQQALAFRHPQRAHQMVSPENAKSSPDDDEQQMELDEEMENEICRCVRVPGSPSLQCAPVRILVCALWGPAAAALALPAGPGEAACALCQSAPRDPVRADCGHRFCRACVVRFWAEEDGPFPCPECADDCWERAVEPGRPPLSRRLLALEEAAAAPTRDGPASEAALQLLCRADGGPLCAACRMAAGPEPPEWEPRWRKALRGKENKGSVEVMKKDLNDARNLHGQAESAAAVWKGHVMDRRKKALTDYKKLRAFFAEEEGRFLQEAEKEEGSLEDEDEDPAERFRSLLQAVSELERRHRNLGLNMLLQ